MTKRLSSASAILCIAFLPATACSGVIRGVLHVPPPVRSSTMPGMYASQGNSMPGAHEVMRGLASDAVIYVDHVPPGADSALVVSAPHPTLAQKNQSFEPRVLAIAVGTAVDFPNFDPIFHNVFSLSPARKFDLGKYSRGHFKTVVFDHEGLINVYCDLHSNMEAFVRVLPHRGFTRPAADGTFALPELPAGRYLLRIWHPDLSEATRTVVVPDTGDVQLEVSL